MNRSYYSNYQPYYKTTPPPPIQPPVPSQPPPPLPPVPPPPNNPPPPPPSGNWSSWSGNSQQQYYQRSSSQFSVPPPNVPNRSEQRPSNFYSSNNRYSQQRFTVGTTNGQYANANQQNWHRNNLYNNKRHLTESSDSGYDSKSKPSKKKKKPLSQANPSKKEWTAEEAERAWNAEKEYDTHSKNSLIIKIPDLELTREIVSNFHPSIANVHFQQPSMARYCFVKLKDGIDTEKVIQELNQTKFGHGYLQAEHKKCLETEKNIGPQDIDPLTLFVGNLAQDVTKQDMVKAYPRQKRIDIGHAKKMKNTRYAFIQFHNADDALEAFERTHSMLLYSRSLIVRFRRLRGTIGMPGESKPQNEPKQIPQGAVSPSLSTSTSNNSRSVSVGSNDTISTQTETDIDAKSNQSHSDGSELMPIKIKEEQTSDNELDDFMYSSDYAGEDSALEASLFEMRPPEPMVEVKKEKDADGDAGLNLDGGSKVDEDRNNDFGAEDGNAMSSLAELPEIKTEPSCDPDYDDEYDFGDDLADDDFSDPISGLSDRINTSKLDLLRKSSHF